MGDELNEGIGAGSGLAEMKIIDRQATGNSKKRIGFFILALFASQR